MSPIEYKSKNKSSLGKTMKWSETERNPMFLFTRHPGTVVNSKFKAFKEEESKRNNSKSQTPTRNGKMDNESQKESVINIQTTPFKGSFGKKRRTSLAKESVVENPGEDVEEVSHSPSKTRSPRIKKPLRRRLINQRVSLPDITSRIHCVTFSK